MEPAADSTDDRRRLASRSALRSAARRANSPSPAATSPSSASSYTSVSNPGGTGTRPAPGVASRQPTRCTTKSDPLTTSNPMHAPESSDRSNAHAGRCRVRLHTSSHSDVPAACACTRATSSPVSGNPSPPDAGASTACVSRHRSSDQVASPSASTKPVNLLMPGSEGARRRSRRVVAPEIIIDRAGLEPTIFFYMEGHGARASVTVRPITAS
eukprot:scaffold5977_cov103-Isochrysis_galbana.AAC.3